MRILLLLLLCFSSHLFAQVQAITESNDGSIWIGSNDRLLKMAGMKIEVASGYSANGRINALVGDANRTIWVGTDQNLVRCANGDCKNFTGIPAAKVISLAKGKNQSLWILAEDKFYNIQGKTVTSAAIPSTELAAFAVDQKGNVWVGTRSAVKRYLNGRFEDVLPTFAQAMTVDDKGALWIGSGHEVMRWQNGTKETFLLPAPPANVRMRPPITSILRTKSEKLYVGTTLGLFSLTGKAFQKVADAEVHALLEDSNGTVWIGTADGLKRMTQGKTFDVPLPANRG
jgi:ligand-binding sensor domain-containing protein